jgi:hypothetical protein
MKIKWIAAVVATSLGVVGCNSSSGGNGGSGGDGDVGVKKGFTVIDGYLQNAYITSCKSIAPLSDCTEHDWTDDAGKVSIKENELNRYIVANVIGGISSDSDTIGVSPRSYTMIADSESGVVTPFTTMAVINDQTIEELGATLGLDSDVIGGDYIEQQDKAAHLLARTMTKELDSDLDNNDGESLLTIAEEVNRHINEIDNDVDLDDVEIDVEVGDDDKPIVEDKPRVSTVSDFLERDLEITFSSLNRAYQIEEEIESGTYIDGMFSFSNSDESWPYSIEEDKVTFTFEDNDSVDYEVDRYIYVSQALALSVPVEDGDLIVHSIEPFDVDNSDNHKPFTTQELVDTTWYQVSDLSETYTPEPALSTWAFSENDVTITHNGTESTGFYHIVDERLIIDLEEVSITVTRLSNNGELAVIHTKSFYDEGTYSLFTSDHDFANTLIANWEGEVEAPSDNLVSLLESGKLMYHGTFNSRWHEDEGVFSGRYDDGVFTSPEEPGEEMHYEITGMTLVLLEDDDKELNEFLHIADNVGLAVTEQGDLGVTTHHDISSESIAYTRSELVGKTFYYLADDSTSKTPDPMIAKMTFNETHVQISEPFAREEAEQAPWHIEGGMLHIALNDMDPNQQENDIVLRRAVSGDTLSIVMDSGPSSEYFAAMFTDELEALTLFNSWVDYID